MPTRPDRAVSPARAARPSQPADLVVRNARIRTLVPSAPWASAVAIRGGEIVAVGADRDVAPLAGPGTETIDGGGTLSVVPGLTDAHIHPVWGAELAVGADLNGLTTLAAVHAALTAEAAATPAGEWVRGWGLDPAVLGGQPISSAAIAAAVGDRPALVLCYDLHTAVATRPALALAGVDGPRAFGDASEIVCDADGPTGELREPSAYRLVLDAAPGSTGAAFRRRVGGVLRDLARLGLTGGHAMDGTPEGLALYTELEQEGALCQRVVVPFWQRPDATEAEIEEQLALRDARGRRWRGGVAKFFVDGVIETGTAWLEEPDSHGEGLTPYWPDPERYRERVVRFARAGFQCVSHAIGDRAVRASLDAYAAAGVRAANGAPHRVEHLELVTDRDVTRIAAEGVVASMQPLYMQARRADGSDIWTGRVGSERAARAFRTRDLLNAGAQLALGSDWPVSPVDPRVGMAWARLRRPPGQPDVEVLEPAQRLTALEALQGYTSGAADAVGEPRQGRIAPGCAGDLTAFAADPVEVSADELPDLPVCLTVVDGEIVFRAEESR
ncbi:amidohydrolase [Conexibacter woesei]|uniref:Amidohydrolase 3 n=1 Tax=Conexibacter woesei (strain DSM 14684 / CCUG 47730 / CIP 108061 / JCM 11494 / NBRC 100937 / ID131577) TaxID=469383 RepID=D3F8L3_CONWI|nr:amidohydrolase [Conexibacter woesei]ADB50977.1 Amidohydrolase 3 [Conexibacter woesei DSM 14684]